VATELADVPAELPAEVAWSSLRYTEFFFNVLLIVPSVCIVILIEKQIRLFIPC
jgi:hypothetical protein